MTEEVVEYLPDGSMIVRNTPPAELAQEEERRCILRRLCALEDRLDILEAQHRKLPPVSSEECKPALLIDRPAPLYTGHTVTYEPLGDGED